MKAGTLDKRITFERATNTANDYGEDVPAWASVGERKAAVFYGRGDERRQAAMEGGAQPASFQFHADTLTRTITVRDRINFDGSVWDITAIAPLDRRVIDITATRAI